MGAEVIRIADGTPSLKEAGAQQIALALMGVGALDPLSLAQNAVWDGLGGARAGRAAIGAALAEIAPPDKIRIEQVVTHGKAGSVSGRITRAGTTRLYCHVIRFTSAAQTQVAQIVSFEHAGGKHDV